MEREVRYCTTEDGVRIAYCVEGEGLPLVYMPRPHFSHLELEWEIPEIRSWYEALSKMFTLVRFDARGTGLSDRRVSDLSLEAQMGDIEAVVNALGLDRFAIWGVTLAGPLMIKYAAQHPERVSHLVLWCTGARGAEIRGNQAGALDALLSTDWTLYTETISHVMLGWREPEDAATFAQFIRSGVTQEIMHAAMEEYQLFDATDSLGNVQARTLVVHRRDVPRPDSSCAKELAAAIPDASVRFLEGSSIAPFLGDVESVLDSLANFFGLSPDYQTKRATPSSFRTVLFTDLVGHTEMMRRLGDEKGREVLREHERITRNVLKQHGGTEVKTMGDGFLASFGSVTKAVECSIALQRAFTERNSSAAEPLNVRVGLNAGEPIEEEGDLFGSTVILAARIAAAAEGGEVLASMAVRELCSGKPFLFADRGEFVAKGFEEPVRMFEVSWRG